MYTGNYYDGKTSKAQIASIDLTKEGIYISFVDEDLNKEIVVWDVEKIENGHFAKNERITLKYGDSTHQYLEVSDINFYNALISTYPHRRFNDSGFEFLRRSGVKGILAVGIGLIFLIIVSYFMILPPLAEYLAGKMPVNMEVKLGDQMYDKIIDGYSIDQHRTKKVNEYWRAMHVNSSYLVNITVVHEPIANAFALPGGQIIVYDKILDEMTDYDELAGLLAHEYSHIKLRHSTRIMSRNLAGYLFISLLLNDASGSLAVFVSNANSLKELSYSRKLEHQADEGGYDLLRSVNINPKGMLALFEMLNKENNKVSVPQFISTHPLTEERISYINDRLKKDNQIYPMEYKDLETIWKEIKEQD